MQSDQRQWLFIAGPARSGTTLLASLLDGHPDALVWPFEWRYFAEFFNRIANDNQTAGSRPLLKEFTPILDRFVHDSFTTYYSSISTQGLVDHDAFSRALHENATGMLTGEGFLNAVFRGYEAGFTPEGQSPRYYALKCMTKGFDWRDKDLIERSKFIYLLRPAQTRYSSQRNKFIKKFHCGAVETQERCRRLFWEIKLAREVFEKYNGHPNFLFIELADIKAMPKEAMKKIADFLDMEFSDQLLAPTFLGKPFEGHFHDPKLNKGAILNTESKHTPLTSYEDLLVQRLASGEKNGPALLAAAARSLLMEIRKVYGPASLADHFRLAKIFLEYYRDALQYEKAVLSNMSFCENRVKFPHIVQFASDFNASDVPA
ncbi:sulfotransferase [Desulfatibacillum aliphaticivorans]|uniref:sulfotransferase n=1 Tax=Desulfatibacillum aliphaticivorans TaxID=218208 RepID=UPI00040E8D2B|nr:sulfotransferase [Desulfatibacillum aliphaticivorans]